VPALPLDEAGKYVAGAYVVLFTLIVVYVAIIGAKIGRIERQIDEIVDLVESDRKEVGRSPAVHAGQDALSPHQDAGLEAPRR
jgi:hypothetical protein